MKIQREKNKIKTMGSQSRTKASVLSNSYVFETLVSKVYSDSMKAWIREVSCNAADANAFVGKQARPIKVTLPSKDNPNFIIADDGPGLSKDELEEIYINCGGSGHDKRKSNDFTGGFGIGSLSPLSYAQSILIKSVKHGVMCRATFSKGEDGIPCLDVFSETKTTESNGVEITVPVRTTDISNCLQKAREVYLAFKVKPEFSNGNLNLSNFYYSDDKVAYFNGSGYHRTVKVIMGNVIYNTPVRHNTPVDLHLRVPVGTFEPQASREQLYNKDGDHAKIQKLVNEFKDFIATKYSKELANSKSIWQACAKAQAYSRWNLNSLKLKGEVVPDRIDICKDDAQKIRQLSYSGKSERKHEYSFDIVPRTNTVIILSDVRDALSRVRNHYGRVNHTVYRFIGTLEECKKAFRCCEDDITLASSLPEAPKVVRQKGPPKLSVDSAKILSLDMSKLDGSRITKSDFTIESNVPAKCVYAPIQSYKILDKVTTSWHPKIMDLSEAPRHINSLYNMMQKYFPDSKLYLPKPSKTKDFRQNDDCILLSEFIKEAFKLMKGKELKVYRASRSYEVHKYLPDNPSSKLLKEYAEIMSGFDQKIFNVLSPRDHKPHKCPIIEKIKAADPAYKFINLRNKEALQFIDEQLTKRGM